MTIPQLPIMMDLFEGSKNAYGTYKIEGEAIPGEKKVGRAATIRKDVDDKLWQAHLEGKQGLGIIPITELNNVKFGAIDIDKYDLDHKELIAKIGRYRMPLIVCRTKSGGAHCYTFLDGFTSAKLVQSKLREMAALLGFGTAEIYPKQTVILSERGDMGQWINIPYFDHEKTNRYAFDKDGRMLTLSMFCDLALANRITEADLKRWSGKIGEALPNGPPCLNQLCEQGFPEGTRNNGLFNLGVYAMKSSPDGWEKVLGDLNQQFMKPPLTPVEVMGVIKSLKKKEYNYSCNQAPIQPFCNAVKCRTCKFGVGTGSGLPTMGTLTKLETVPPTWFIDIEDGGRLELCTEDLQNARGFQLVCMNTLNMVPVIPPKKDWDLMMQKMMENVSVIEVPVDMLPEGQLLEMLERFCGGRVQARQQDEILLGKPWLNGGRHYFQVSSLLAFLDRNRFKYESVRWICKVLRDRGGKHDFFNIKSGEGRKGFNVWSVPEFIIRTEPLKTPEQAGAVPFE